MNVNDYCSILTLKELDKSYQNFSQEPHGILRAFECDSKFYPDFSCWQLPGSALWRLKGFRKNLWRFDPQRWQLQAAVTILSFDAPEWVQQEEFFALAENIGMQLAERAKLIRDEQALYLGQIIPCVFWPSASIEENAQQKQAQFQLKIAYQWLIQVAPEPEASKG